MHPARKPHRTIVPPRSVRGFALLITITLLAFLVLLLVSLASLTRVETQVADNSQRLSQARAHAMFALNAALGQLQQFAGPDRRVTASAALGDSASNNHPVSVGGTHHWTGVWGNANPASDDRSAPVFLNWLVSGNETVAVQANADGSIASAAATPAKMPDQAVANLAAATARSTDITIGGVPGRLLVGPGTVGTAASGGLGEPGYVAAPMVSIEVTADQLPGQSGSGAVTVGRYAWWVGDEGIKARANLVASEAAVAAAGEAEQRLRYRLPARAGIELMADAPTAFANTDLEAPEMASVRAELRKVYASPQLSLLSAGGLLPPVFQQKRFHDFSTSSQGVLANVLAGGLRKDLTAGFAEGTTKTDAPIGPIWKTGATDATTGPDWQLLRAYYQLPFSSGATGVGGSLGLSPQAHLDGTTDTSKPAQHGIFPLVAFWQWYVEGRVTPLAAGEAGLELRYYPAVVLWNPYNVTLRDHTYRLTYTINGGDITFMRVSARTAGPQTYTRVPPAISPEAQLATPWVNGMQLAVRSGDIEPGVAYVYTLRNHVYFSTDTFTPYTMERGWHAGGTRAVIVSGNSFALPGADNSNYMVSLWSGTNHSGANSVPSWAAETQTVPSSVPSGGVTEPVIRDDNLALSTAAGDALQYVSHNNTFENAFKLRWGRTTHLFQDLRSVVGYVGHRWALKTTALDTLGDGASHYKNYPVRWLANYNPRAPLSARSPFEAQGNDVGYGYFATNPSYNFTRDAKRYGTGAFDPVNANAAIPCDPDTGRAFVGMSQATWDGPGESRVVLFNVPRREHPLVSLGELQHAQPYRVNGIPFAANASPAYAIGNSLAEPRGRLDAAAKPWSEIAIGSSSYQTYKPAARVFDHSYLLNRALWDGYYFSTVPRGGASDPVSFPLANPRLVAHASASHPSDLRDYEKSAASLMVAGAFNINSTSAQAWRALLGGLSNVPVSGTRRPKESPYPRTGYPVDDSIVFDAAAAGDAGMNAVAYEGYRFLTEAQIAALADQIVLQVRRRGPFLSVADFVNRALDAGAVPATQDNRLKGALARALEDAGINQAFSASQQAIIPPTGGSGYTTMLESAAAGATATHVPGWLSQADLLQSLGPVISARSDTFTIRAYGEALNPVLASADAGYIQGRAWCEAVVQRVPEYAVAGDEPWESGADLSTENRTFGRRLVIVSFRWLSAEDI